MSSINDFFDRIFPQLKILSIVCCLVLAHGAGNDARCQIFGGGNDKPKITAQRSLSTQEEQPITVLMTDLTVEDENDILYPVGFTMQLYEGVNYTFSDHTVTPARDFTGVLTVPVTVSDGEKKSDKFDLKITVTNVNDRPLITGQSAVTMSEDITYQITSGVLTISDPDDNQFSVAVQPGTNYTVSGQSITPAANFSGTLTVPVSVSDGEASSNEFSLQIAVSAVNDPPKIISQQSIKTTGGVPVSIQLSSLTVEDPDDVYPSDFTLRILDGQNYSVSSNQITPASTFSGMLTVGIRVSDGTAESPTFNLQVEVAKASGKPVITNQKPVLISEDQSFTISLNDLFVNAGEKKYPNGFVLKVSPGDNYQVSNGSTITPARDFHGNLFVPVSVSDGTVTSDTHNFLITVSPVNDAPTLAFNSPQDSSALHVSSNDVPVSITQPLMITDVDNDSLTLAEVTFTSGYLKGNDILSFVSNPSSPIKGVFDAENGVLALIGKASLSQYNQAFQSINYQFTGEALERGLVQLRFMVSDGLANSNPLYRRISFSPDNSVIGSLNIPNAFTPNGDFVNDTWWIYPTENPQTFENATVRIYTKSGLLVFESKGLGTEWNGEFNGKMLPADVYFYTIELGDEVSQSSSSLKGVVTILR
jgi:gliding motility-associated-like protein